MPATISAEQLALLDKVYSSPSANRKGGGVFPRAEPPPSVQPSAKYPSPVGMSDNGSFRQPPNIPNNVSSERLRGLMANNNNGVPTQNTPIATKQYGRFDLPNPRPPLGTRLGAGLDRASGGLALASSALSVSSSIMNAAKKRDLASTINAVADTAATGLMMMPHPLAKGAGLLLMLGKTLFGSFFNSPENAKQDYTQQETYTPPFTGQGCFKNG